MKLKLKNVRVNWTDRIFTSQDFDGNGQFKFSTDVIFDEDSDNHQAMLKTIDEVGKGEFAEKWSKVKTRLFRDNLVFIKVGDDNEDKQGEIRAGYKDKLYLKASNDKKPFALDRARNHITEKDDIIYNGCYCNVLIDIWAQNNKYGQRINVKLLGVQFFEKGDPIGSGATANIDDFDEYEQDTDMGEDYVDEGEYPDEAL